ncbi:MarR family winged helix-turn-helix transcriptional regulator [Anaerovirgula multivorans]|uniref:MarR family winged helix-turn-helix transcriptional regulator n=1 Tax=Anaerovirgula multivorans TaxID=312168 RepID=UPI000B7832C9|nr:MarR family transcriptional regulator [Anaerovirgula multivorans]
MKEILREVGMIARCFESISNIEFKEFKLARGQYLYLVRICENPGIIQERIAEMLKVDRTTASRSIKNLVSSGLIEKLIDCDNKKILKLYPTEKGKRLYPFLKREEEYSNKMALNGLTQEEQETILKLLYKIRKNIETDWEIVKKGGKRKYLSERNINL